ncbi:replication factor C small subunit [Candidatus Micrarchaeota archaeon]|nr:replication factor C small subunit [Candidatus Micrarchaeota archaeon]MBU1930008.1 replication factor C small subunit [Candidatus Micrarchaeota archaeon]
MSKNTELFLELPWIEKYRPKELKEIIGQTSAIKRLQTYTENKNMPHLLFSGPAGVGKTTSAIALAHELYKNGFERNFLELNASDTRGIDVVRGTIKDFARTLAFDSGFKIIFLDESDALTTDAQQALRRTMEKYTKTCRFILSCNYSSKIIEPIQSRCVVFRFKPLSGKEVEIALQRIAKVEGLQLDETGLKAIQYVAQGDLRKAINVLQASASNSKKILEDQVFSVSSRAKPAEIKQMITAALTGKFLEARDKLDTLLYEHGMSGEDVLLQLYREVLEMPEAELPTTTKIALVDIIGEYNFRMVEGANERIQLEALLAQLMKFKK